MPEGDTLRRTARTLDAALAGQVVRDVRSSIVAVEAAARRLGVVGATVDRVESVGKHLLVRLTTGAALHTHLGMKGSWLVFRREGFRRPLSSRPRVQIETANAVAFCRRAPVVEILSALALAAHPALTRLGPDLLDPDFDASSALQRLRRRPEEEIGVALLDQTAVAGIGNVYKSEALYLGGVSPVARVRDLDDTTLERLITLARDLLGRNTGGGERRTTPRTSPTPLWVYRRTGRPCPRCGEAIRRIVQGEQARSTWLCPGCQGAGPAG